MISIYSQHQFIKECTWSGEPMTAAQFLQEQGLWPELPCGGHGLCGKCRVYLLGDVQPPDQEEQDRLTEDELARGVRLACRAVLCGENIRISMLPQQQMSIETGTMPEDMVWQPWTNGLGLSVDIGTTTVAAYLWDLDNKRLLGVRACKNPQERFGADVISRLEASLEGHGEELRRCICNCLNTLAAELCRGHCCTAGEIRSAVITGNTSMLYLLCGYDVHDIAFVPFTAAHRFGEMLPAAKLGLQLSDEAQVYLPPCISAYVGADIACGLLDCDALSAEKPALLADVGTNGELALVHNGSIYCCATAAGPAFEGVGISCGSSAISGAIDRAWIENDTLCVHTIGEEAPIGICGSGLMDAVHCLVKLEQIEDSGFTEDDELPLGGSVVLTQKDIRAFQLAKGAVCAGMETLLHHAALKASALEQVWLCGGFGNKLSVESAAGIGLLPAAMAQCVRTCGNTAAAGAARLLCDKTARQRIQDIVARCELVELAESPVFQERFMEDMLLGEVRE